MADKLREDGHTTKRRRNANQNHDQIPPAISMATTKQNKTPKYHVLARMWGKPEPCALSGGVQTGAAAVETAWGFLAKLKGE